jgi:hypothetical protein
VVRHKVARTDKVATGIQRHTHDLVNAKCAPSSSRPGPRHAASSRRDTPLEPRHTLKDGAPRSSWGPSAGRVGTAAQRPPWNSAYKKGPLYLYLYYKYLYNSSSKK